MVISKCLNCGNTEESFPLIKLLYKGEDHWICPQCMPGLIHKTEIIIQRLSESSTKSSEQNK
jgi:hypothetical protein